MTSVRNAMQEKAVCVLTVVATYLQSNEQSQKPMTVRMAIGRLLRITFITTIILLALRNILVVLFTESASG
jgi:hypothetical protein